MKKKIRYLCCSIIFIVLLMISISYAAACPINGRHDYSPATCTKPKTCDCGATSGKPKGHNYSEATCTARAKCKVCGTTTGRPKGHNYKVTTIKEATTTSEGTRQYKCKNCGKTYTETISKKESPSTSSNNTCTHSYTGKVTVEATCKSDGKIVYTCSKCKNSYTSTIAQKEHKYSSYQYLSKTKHYKECDMCGNKITSNHEFSNGKCKLCGYTNCEHKQVSDPTCTKAGKCKLCGWPVKPALGHSYGEYIQNENYHIGDCSRCSESKQEKHKFVKDKVVREATCIEEGEIQYKCSICGYLKTDAIKKVSHVYTGGKGYASDPVYHYTCCKWCQAVYSKGIKHTWNKGTCIYCNYVCKHSYEAVKDGGKIKLRCTLCKMEKADDTCEHEYEYISDVYGHYYMCKKCKNTDKTKSGTHKYETKTIDLCNGYHEKKCTTKECNFVLRTQHIYINGKCVSCGSQNATNIQLRVDVTGLTIDLGKKTKDSMALQEKLIYLGYSIGSIDGDIGSNTIKGLNAFLADQGSSREIKNKNEITPEVFQLLMICEETKEQAKTRINKKQAENLFKDLDAKVTSGEAKDTEKIQYAQIVLQKLGYYPATEGINGSLNNTTKDALKIYCISNGIDVSIANVEDLDFAFLKKMGSTIKTYAEVKREKLAQIKSGKVDFDMSSENQRMEIQLMLKASGYYNDSIDGKFGNNTKNALKQLYEDKGLGSPNITDWDQITLEEFTVIANTDKKGLEEYKRSDENDKTWIGAVKDGSEYRATHGFRYCMRCGKTSVIVDDSVRATCKNSKCEHKGAGTVDGNYVTDCSTALTSDLYYYAKANDSKTLMNIFSEPRYSGSYYAAVQNDGYIDGVKCFDVIESKEDIQEGDIFVYYKELKDGHEGHVEVYAGSMTEDNIHANVYNAGDYTSVATAGVSRSSHDINKYKILRPIPPEEVQKLDSAN